MGASRFLRPTPAELNVTPYLKSISRRAENQLREIDIAEIWVAVIAFSLIEMRFSRLYFHNRCIDKKKLRE